MIDEDRLKVISKETLDTFEDISSAALSKLQQSTPAGVEALASTNTFTGGKAVENVSASSAASRTGYEELTKEPAICRVSAVDEDGNPRLYYISRRWTVPLGKGRALASRNSEVGRLAALGVGDEITLELGGKETSFEVLENIRYQPRMAEGAWDSWNTIFYGEDYGPVSVESLRALLREVVGEESGEALLDAILAGSTTQNVIDGLRHEVRRSMALRDQPILDKFQDDIFRLPLDSRLLILGPPGTGKTTTLIRRLGQKLDPDALSAGEQALLRKIGNARLPHEKSWVMYTPTELLKHFVKEAFGREQVPAPNERIKTWETQRNELARNVLGILQSSNTKGKFVLKAQNRHLRNDVVIDPREWFELFRAYHRQRVLDQLNQGLQILEGSREVAGDRLVASLAATMGKASQDNLMAVYRDLDASEDEIVAIAKTLKEASDKRIKTSLVLMVNQNKEFLNDLAKLLDSLQEEEDSDEDEAFDDDAAVEGVQQATSAQKAAHAYYRTIRTLARSKFLKRSVQKGSTAAQVRDWLGEVRLPSDSDLHNIGESIAVQNGLRRFIKASKRLVADVPISYKLFRREAMKAGDWYEDSLKNSRHVDGMELDSVLLLMLRSARELLGQRFIGNQLDGARFELLRSINQELLNQVLVDEATDFSAIQLGCMEALTRLETGSFFACGDFNQRITQWGSRSRDQFDWAVSGIKDKTITMVYRQSQKLNDFAAELIEVLGGDKESLGELPEHMHHTGFSPVLLEGTPDIEDVAIWLTERIQEVERIVDIGQLPTIAILVNAEKHVQPMADALNHLLEDINLRAVPCLAGQSLGVGTDVRVFSVEHIKGLEFEAVFFVGVDSLAKQLPDLFGKYLYVGATRAATYLGMTCDTQLPAVLDPLRASFSEEWGVGN